VQQGKGKKIKVKSKNTTTNFLPISDGLFIFVEIHYNYAP